MKRIITREEINPCIRNAGIENIQENTLLRMIYDYEVVYCHIGQFTVHFTGETKSIGPGEIMVIPPKVSHTIDYSNAHEVYWVHFDFTYHDNQKDLSRYIESRKDYALASDTFDIQKARNAIIISPGLQLPDRYKVINPQSTLDSFQQLNKLYHEKPNNWHLNCKLLLLELLSETLNHLTPIALSKSDTLSGQVHKYLETNCHRKISLNELADYFHYQKDVLNRLVKKETGFTIFKLLNSIRLEKAEHLLLYSALTLDNISEACGYTDRSHFIRHFKIKHQCTPKIYRANKSIP